MKLFGQLIRTAVNVATLPVAVVRDVTGESITTGRSATLEALERLKEEADE